VIFTKPARWCRPGHMVQKLVSRQVTPRSRARRMTPTSPARKRRTCGGHARLFPSHRRDSPASEWIPRGIPCGVEHLDLWHGHRAHRVAVRAAPGGLTTFGPRARLGGDALRAADLPPGPVARGVGRNGGYQSGWSPHRPRSARLGAVYADSDLQADRARAASTRLTSMFRAPWLSSPPDGILRRNSAGRPHGDASACRREMYSSGNCRARQSRGRETGVTGRSPLS
jgi:hypothetical protein